MMLPMHQVLTITNKRPADHSGKKTFSARNSSLYAMESQTACRIEGISTGQLDKI
jgi:hypothetical protein